MNILHVIEEKILLVFAELFKIQRNYFFEMLSILFCVALIVFLVWFCVRMAKQPREIGYRGVLKRIGFYTMIGVAGIFFMGLVIHLSLVLYIAHSDYKLKDFAFDETQFDQKLLNVDIYDQKGNKVTTIINDGVNRENVSLNEMPTYLKEAFVNVEDKNFYQHSGISIRGYLRAIYTKILHPSQSMNGGSTLTQQLIKNVNGDMYNRNVLHKYQEALLSIIIENKYSKKQILEMYLNRIYLGEGNVYGVGTAAKHYFNKDVSDLTLTESAFLAGLPQAPSAYTKDLVLGNQRKNTVLAVMKENKSITTNQFKQASQQTVGFNKTASTQQTALDAYIDYVLKEAKERYGLSENDLKHKGYSIYTYLDANLQQSMYEQAQSFTYRDDQNTKGEKVQVGIAAVNPSTEKLTAIYGGRDYIRGYRNRAYDRFQPGSILKPLIVYGPAFETKKWNAFSTVNDEKRSFNTYAPKNAGEKYEGNISVERALIRSANIPAVTVFQDIGVDKGVSVLKKLGIPVKKADKDLHLALGGMEKGVTPIEMAQSYATFVNFGYFQPAEAIKFIKDKNEHVVEPKTEASSKGKDLYSPETAYHMTEILKKVISDPIGTGKNAAIGRPVAGKTGTAEEAGTTGNRASWFVGYTPDISMAIHLGFDKPSKELYLTTAGGDEPAKLFANIMKKAYAGVPSSDFQKPLDVKSLSEGPLLSKVNNVKTKYDKQNKHVIISWDPNKTASGVTYKVFKKGKNGEDVEIGSTTNTVLFDDHLQKRKALETIPEDANWFEKIGIALRNMSTIVKNIWITKQTYYVIATYQDKASEPSNDQSIYLFKEKANE